MKRKNAELFEIRPWHLRMGATDEEITRTLPGDEVEPEAGNQVTQAISINSDPENVWRCLVRLGQTPGDFNGEGVFVENDRQDTPSTADDGPLRELKVNDRVHCIHTDWVDGRDTAVAIWFVIRLEPHRSLVLREERGRGTWAFVLKPTHDGHTRLLVRVRGNKPPEFGTSLFDYGVFEPAQFIMERNAMLALKQLAENDHHPSRPTAVLGREPAS